MPATPYEIAEGIQQCSTAKEQAASTSLATAKTIFLASYSNHKATLSDWAQDTAGNPAANATETQVAENLQKLFKHEQLARTSDGAARTIFMAVAHETQKSLNQWAESVLSRAQSPDWGDCPPLRATQASRNR